MTLAQVKHVLGSGYSVDERDSPATSSSAGTSRAGRSTFEQQRAVLVSTTVRGAADDDRRRAGSALAEGRRTPIPGGRCTFKLVNYYLAARVPRAAPAAASQTLFVFARTSYDEAKAETTGYQVIEAIVRTPYEPLPEFAPGWREPVRGRLGDRPTVPRLKRHH